MLHDVAGKLGQYMDLLSYRQKLVASNLANLDTPGYKTRDIDFGAELGRLMSSAAAGAGETQPHTIEPELASKNDGKNVGLDRETRMLAETGMRFQLASLLARSEIRMVRSAIQEGK
jgi:flagellar basal-body rod protein FlgB